MRIAIAGGAGFIGRHVVRELLEAGADVTTIDVRAPARRAAGEHLVTANLLEPGQPEAVAQSLGAVDGVVWLAARIRQQTGVDATAAEDLALMVDAPSRLLRALEPAPAVFVHISSIQVYGRPTRLPVDESDPKAPMTAYGVAKRYAEQVLDIAGARRGTAVTSLRLAFVYGPGQHPANVLPRFLGAVRRGEAPVVHGKGGDVRDDVFVGDVARAVRLAVERRARGAFNIASGEPHTILDVARAAASLGPAGLEPVHDDAPSHWVDRAYAVDRARDAIGFTSQISFGDGVRAMWDAGDGA